VSELLLIAVLEARLTPNQRDVFLDQHLLGKTLTELAGEYGVTRSAVGHSSKKARRKLGRVMVAMREAA